MSKTGADCKKWEPTRSRPFTNKRVAAPSAFVRLRRDGGRGLIYIWAGCATEISHLRCLGQRPGSESFGFGVRVVVGERWVRRRDAGRQTAGDAMANGQSQKRAGCGDRRSNRIGAERLSPRCVPGDVPIRRSALLPGNGARHCWRAPCVFSKPLCLPGGVAVRLNTPTIPLRVRLRERGNST